MNPDEAALPPYDEVAEQSVLSAMLGNATAATIAADILKPDDFYIPRHRALFTILTDLHPQHPDLDVVVVRSAIETRGEWERVGGGEYLDSLLDVAPTPANIAAYCEIVRQRSIDRDLLDAATKVARAARGDSGMTEREAVAAMHAALSRERQQSEPQTLANIMTLENLTPPDRIPTGLPALDDALRGGFVLGGLYVLAGLQGRGKSTVSGNLARLVAAGGVPTLAINLEDSRDNLLRRLAAAESRMALAAVERLHNGLDARQKDIILAGMERLKTLPITVDSETRDLHAIVARIRTAARNGVKFVVLDQASWVRVEDATTEYEQATPVSEALTIAAHTLHVTILLNVQINRSGAAAHSAQKRLELHHLRASGRYEADADGVLIIQNATGDGPDKTLELDVLKHRHGPSRKTCTLLWTPCQALVTTAQGHEQAADVQAPRSQASTITPEAIISDMGDETFTERALRQHVAECLGLKSRTSTFSGRAEAMFEEVKRRTTSSHGAFQANVSSPTPQCPV